MEDKKFQKADEVTQEMIREWEEKYGGNVKKIAVALSKDDVETGEKAFFFIRKPDRMLINQTTKFSAEKDYEKANTVMVKNCVLGGDMKYLDPEQGDDDVFFAVLDALGSLIAKKKARFLN